jgi:hypothetical protein
MPAPTQVSELGTASPAKSTNSIVAPKAKASRSGTVPREIGQVFVTVPGYVLIGDGYFPNAPSARAISSPRYGVRVFAKVFVRWVGSRCTSTPPITAGQTVSVQ